MTGLHSAETCSLAENDRETFLELMCQGFGMDIDAARPIFYEDPYFELNNRYLLRIDGHAVSCLTVTERTCRIGQALLRVAGIAGLTTASELRGRGYAGRLLMDVLAGLKSREFAIAALFPVSADYYRKFGWTPAAETPVALQGMATLTLENVPDVIVRPANESDIDSIAELYEAVAREHALYCTRDAKRWQYLLSYVPRGCVACTEERVGAYMLYDVQPELDESASESEDPPRQYLRVLEMHGRDIRCIAALRSHLASQRDVSSVRFSAPTDVLSDCQFGPATHQGAPLMARVVSWPQTVSALCAEWHGRQLELGLVLVDPLLGPAPDAVLVRGQGEEAVAAPTTAPGGAHGDFIVGSVEAWSPVVTGYVSAAFALESGALKASTIRAARMAEDLFPERSPFLPPADHF